MLIICFEVKKLIFSRNLIALHATCDVIGIAQHLFLKCQIAAKYFALCQNSNFASRFAFKNVRNRTKTDLVTLILYSWMQGI